jgi:hypothetical protein
MIGRVLRVASGVGVQFPCDIGADMSRSTAAPRPMIDTRLVLQHARENSCRHPLWPTLANDPKQTSSKPRSSELDEGAQLRSSSSVGGEQEMQRPDRPPLGQYPNQSAGLQIFPREFRSLENYAEAGKRRLLQGLPAACRNRDLTRTPTLPSFPLNSHRSSIADPAKPRHSCPVRSLGCRGVPFAFDRLVPHRP